MRYSKANAEVVVFEKDNVFMAASYGSAEEALMANCTGYSGKTNNFTCSDFGGYNATNPPEHGVTVVLGSGEHTFVFDYVGNHWKLSL